MSVRGYKEERLGRWGEDYEYFWCMWLEEMSSDAAMP
jgi:hypothetical protein